MTNLITANLNDVTNVLANNGVKLYSFNHNISYDCDLSQIYFDDFKADIENQSLWFDSYLVIFANEALKTAPYYKKSHLAKMSKQALYDLCEQYEILSYYHSEWNIEDNTKQTLINELMKYCTNEKYYTYYFNESSWHELDCTFIIRGHCQGDAYQVLLVGEVDTYLNSETLENIFYNTPLSGCIEVALNGTHLTEINLYDLKDFNEYACYDKGDIVSMVNEYCSNSEYSVLLNDYLESNLKSTFDYTH